MLIKKILIDYTESYYVLLTALYIEKSFYVDDKIKKIIDILVKLYLMDIKDEGLKSKWLTTIDLILTNYNSNYHQLDQVCDNIINISKTHVEIIGILNSNVISVEEYKPFKYWIEMYVENNIEYTSRNN